LSAQRNSKNEKEHNPNISIQSGEFGIRLKRVEPKVNGDDLKSTKVTSPRFKLTYKGIAQGNLESP